jgi:hypothetical protein
MALLAHVAPLMSNSTTATVPGGAHQNDSTGNSQHTVLCNWKCLNVDMAATGYEQARMTLAVASHPDTESHHNNGHTKSAVHVC